MISRICGVQKRRSIEEQVSEIIKNRKDIYFFGGLGSMSLASVNIQYLKRKQIDFKGFIANRRFIQNNTHLGKPVFAIEDCQIPRDANVIIGISNWVDAKKELESRGFKNIFLFDSFAEIFLDKISLEYLKDHQKEFEYTYSILEDDQSRQTMIAYLQGKVMHNYDGLALTYSGGGAYFNSVLKFQEDEIMIDCGAYDGDTALAFAKVCPNYRKIYALEPNLEILPTLKKRVENLKIEICEVGAYSRRDTLSFQSQESGCSSVSKEGDFSISVDCVDHLVANEKDSITFIKMDIEGSELEALKGASETIKKYKPKLAICVYHRKNDLIEIPKLIKELRPDYRLYLRNHQCVPEDSVLYAL